MMLTRKIAAVAVSSLIMLSMAGITASAATVTQDGLNVSLTTDKTEYKKDEAITATLTVENTGGTSVKDVKLENIVPEGYELAKDYSLTKSVDELKSNDKAELKVVYNAKTGGNVTPSNSSTTQSNTVTTNTTTTASSAATSTETAQTGDTAVAIVIIAVIVVSLGLGFLALRKKKGRSLLSVALTVSILGTAMAVVSVETNAAGISKTIEVTEKIKADNNDKVIKAKVTFNPEKTIQESSQQSESSEISEVSLIPENTEFSEQPREEYYNQNAKVISVIQVTESKNVISEKEVVKLLSDRGFTPENITADFDINGKLLSDTQIDSKSDKKHPLYSMLYYSESKLIWNVYVVDGVVFAYPVSYNLESKRSAPLLITETNTVISHDSNTNQYYETIPNEETLITRKIEKISKESLDKFTIGGLEQL